MHGESVGIEQRSAVSLRNVVGVLFKYKNSMLMLLGVSILTAIGYLLYVDASYEAEVKILVLLGPEKFSAMESYNREEFSVVFQERGENIANELEIIRDKAIALNVLDRFKELKALAELEEVSIWKKMGRWWRKSKKWMKDIIKWPLYQIGLATKLTDDELMLLELQGSLHVEFLEVTDIIRATFRNSDPDVAAFLLNAYVEEYLAHRMRVLSNFSSKGFYDDQIQLASDKLGDIEATLEKFRDDADISSLILQRDLILNEINKVQFETNEKLRELDQVEIAIQVVKTAHEKDNQWVDTPETDRALPDFRALDNRYMELFAEKHDLLDTYAESSRKVRSLDIQMKQLRDEKVKNLLSSLDTRKSIIEQLVASYDEELTEHRNALRKLDNNERQLTDLERRRSLIETTYLTYARKAEDLRISSDLTDSQITSVRVISPATPPPVPASPNKKLILALSAFLGLILGFAYTALAQFFSHKFDGDSDVEEALGIPLLASFSFVKTDS